MLSLYGDWLVCPPRLHQAHIKLQEEHKQSDELNVHRLHHS